MKTNTGKMLSGILAAAVCLGWAGQARAFWTDGGQGGGALEQLGISADVKDMELALPQPEAAVPAGEAAAVEGVSNGYVAREFRIEDIPNAEAKRFARAVDRDHNGMLSPAELDGAVARPTAMTTRLLEKAFGSGYSPASVTGADLEALLRGPGAAAESDELPGPSPDYPALFSGPASEWVVAFGGDTHHTRSEMSPPDVSQYRGFKNFLERRGFKCETGQQGVDMAGLSIFSKAIKAPPDGHEHKLSVRVFNSAQYADAAEDYQKVSPERRGYFSLSHTGEGLGLIIGGARIRPENMLKSPAPHLVISAVACRTYGHFAGKINKYMDRRKIPREKLTYMGCTKEIEMTQPNGAMVLLRETFLGTLEGKSLPTIMRNADRAYNPILPSYNPESYRDDISRMVMDSEIQALPVMNAMVGGKPLNKIATDPADPDENELRLRGLVYDAGAGGFIMAIEDIWAKDYAGEKVLIRTELRKDVPFLSDQSLGESEFTLETDPDYRLTILPRGRSKIDGGKYFVKWGFKRIGQISEDTFIEKGDTYRVEAAK